jgi:hypothetical protein
MKRWLVSIQIANWIPSINLPNGIPTVCSHTLSASRRRTGQVLTYSQLLVPVQTEPDLPIKYREYLHPD